MKPVSEIDAVREQAILSSLAGFPFLLVFAFVWIASAALSYVVPREIAPWIYLMHVPVAFAALVGGHFLPFDWIYRTRLYSILGVVVAVGPFALAVLFRDKALHYTGFFVGACLLVGAFKARSHARATWLESRQST